MPNDFVASRCLATANPAAARSSASSHEAGRSVPLSLTSGSVNRACLLIENSFLPCYEPPGERIPGAGTGSISPSVSAWPAVRTLVGEKCQGKDGPLSGRTARRRVLKITLPGDGQPGAAASRADFRADFLAAEEPLGIRVNGAALTMTMRTPGDDVELAAGFLVGEAVIRTPADLAEIRLCDGTSC